MAVTPGQALAELVEGNHRFVTGTRVHPHQDAEHRASLATTQAPFAVVFGCSDSRLAAEIIFDRGLGDLFVIRTAGHTVGAEVLGSIEYAISILGSPLVVVLGHNSCGAVQAAREAVATDTLPSGYLRTVVDAIVPSVRAAGAVGIENPDAIVDLHIQRTVDELGLRCLPLARAVESGRASIVGMSYRLDAGEVRLVTPAPVG
jgi:carbonic anhydrase